MVLRRSHGPVFLGLFHPLRRGFSSQPPHVNGRSLLWGSREPSLLFDVVDEGVEQGSVHVVAIHVKRQRFFVEKPTKFLSQFGFEFVQTALVHDRPDHAALVEGRWDFTEVSEEFVEALPNRGLNFLCFEVFCF